MYEVRICVREFFFKKGRFHILNNIYVNHTNYNKVTQSLAAYLVDDTTLMSITFAPEVFESKMTLTTIN